MKLVNLFKEKSQQFQQFQLSNSELIRRFEPQVRELRESLNQSVSNSFASAWFSKWLAVANEESEIVAVPEAVDLYNALITRVGQEMHLSDWHTISQMDINAFAQVTGDNQWIHVDEVKARRESPFRSTVAHGFLLLALLPRLRDLGNCHSYSGARYVVNTGVQQAQFQWPVKPGQSVRARTTLRKVALHRRGVDITEEMVLELRDTHRRACSVLVEFRVFV